MMVDRVMQVKLKHCHVSGLKDIKIAQYLGVSKPMALMLMNIYLHGTNK